LTIGGRKRETTDWSDNLARPNEKTTMHPNKPFTIGGRMGETKDRSSTLTPCEPSITQDTFMGGEDTKQKTQRETTTSEAGDPREITEKLKKTTSQNPGIKETTKSNLVQILLSGHSNEAPDEEILQMFHPNKAPEIDRRGNYTILQFKDNEAAREGIQSAKERGESGGNPIKTEMYHPLLDDLYNIPLPNKINKSNNTNNQTYSKEQETQPDSNQIAQNNPTPMPFILRPLPYPTLPETTKPFNTQLHQPITLENNNTQTNTQQHTVTPNKEARTNQDQHQPLKNHTNNLYDPLRTLNINARDFKALHHTMKTQLIQSKIQPLLEDKVEPTKILRAIHVIQTATNDHLIKIMTPTGFQEFLSHLDARPTEFKYGRDSHGSNLEYDYRLKIHHTTPKRVDDGWINQPGPVLNTYLDSLTDMLRYYGHTARINPSPENPLNIPTIDILAKNKQLDDSTASRYVYARQQTESGYIKSFEIYITTSYTELGSPPRTQTIEGQEARTYLHAQRKDQFGAHKMERTIHGNPPCVMLARSIRAEDDYRIKAEIIDRTKAAGVDIPPEHFDIVWTTVYSPNTHKKAAAKCITVSPKYHHKIKQIVNALSHDTPHPTTKLAHPLTYDYIAMPTFQQDNVNNQEHTDFESDFRNIDLLLDHHSQYIRTLISTSITGLSGIDLFSTITNSSINGDGTFDTTRMKTLAQLILDGKYMSKSSTYNKSPVDKLTLSENKGRYNLFTTKDRAEQLVEYTEHLEAVIPSWLEGTTKNKGNRIAVSIEPALHQTKKNRSQPRQPLPPMQPNTQPTNPTQNQAPTTMTPQTTYTPTPPQTRAQTTAPNTSAPYQPQHNHQPTNTTPTSSLTYETIQTMKQQLDNLTTIVEHQSQLLNNLITDTKTLTTNQASATTPMEKIQSVISRVDSSITTASETHITNMNTATKETHAMLRDHFYQQNEQITKNNDIQYKNINVMFGDMKSIAENYNGIARNYDTNVNGVVSELLENKVTLARLTTQIDFILTNMANNPDFLKNTGIWEDFVEHQEAFDRVQQELNEEYQRDGSTTTTTQQHETKQCGERKHPPEHENKDGKNTTKEQEPRSNSRQDTAPVAPHNHNAPTERQTETTPKIPHPQKNTDPIDLAISPKHLSQNPTDTINTPNRRPNTPPPQNSHQPQALQASYAPGFNPLEATFLHPPPEKTKRGPGRTRITPADDATQKTPHSTKDITNTETHTHDKKNRKPAHHATQKQTPKI
jgi:hypothetical protein